MTDDLLKKIEALEKRINVLESKQKPNQEFFGRNYSQIGDSTSDICLKTKGKVKIQIGSKFIDLIKDGKINATCESILFKGQPGNKDGFYVTDEGDILLKIGDNIISVVDHTQTVYVSFMEEQQTSSDMKHRALVNIGFLYDSIDSFTSDSLQNGIIYIESEQKLYIVKDGQLIPYTFDFPNPFREQFIIAKDDSNIGSLLIVGEGKTNSVAFNNFWLYSEGDKSIIETLTELTIYAGGKQVVSITKEFTKFLNTVVSNKFQSPDATADYGFRLYMLNGESTLEIDNLIVRNKEPNELINLYPEYWLYHNSIIKSVKQSEENSSEEPTDTNLYQVEFVQPHSLKENDIVVIYIKEDIAEGKDLEEPEEGESEENDLTYSKQFFTVTSIASETSITLKPNEDISLESKNLSNSWVFLIKSDDTPIRIKSNNIDIVEYDDDLNEVIHSRYGNLTELEKEIVDNNSEDTKVEGPGIYSDLGIFREAAYSSDYVLDKEDNSSRFASTEWVKQFLAQDDDQQDDDQQGDQEDDESPVILFSGILESANQGNSASWQPFSIISGAFHKDVSSVIPRYMTVAPTLTLQIYTGPTHSVQCYGVSATVLQIYDPYNQNHYTPDTARTSEFRSAGYWVTGGPTASDIVSLNVWRTGNEHSDSTWNNCLINMVQKISVTIFGTIKKIT